MKIVVLVSLFVYVESFIQPQQRGVRLSSRLAFSEADYAHAVDSLSHELNKVHEGLKKVEILAARLQEMESHNPHIGDIAKDDSLKQVIAEAKAAIELHGTSSAEARTAFHQVDRVAAGVEQEAGEGSSSARYNEASIKHHHAYNAVVDKELLQESMEAIEQVLTLEHFVKVEQKRLDRQGRKGPGLQDRTPGVPWLSP